ncbi:interferon alpha-1-like [Electrophorus electricus]|uniref:interferon alpha-1-like n=1 Tax=Electrophorus electricus TaxID=8005 RepID=UPI0015CF927B|nr:interferon alpha-1-like [Electrophorus electricus]
MEEDLKLSGESGPFPSQCLDDKVEISLPESALLRNASKQVSSNALETFIEAANRDKDLKLTERDLAVAKAVYKTLTSIESLFDNYGIPQSWDGQKLEDFQNIVYRQIDESKCISGKTQKDEDDFSARDAAITDYFEKLKKLLKDMEFSDCAWETVRLEVLSLLQFIVVETSDNEFWSRRV